MGGVMPRTKPYTERGIRRLRCRRCDAPAARQWQICADNNVYRPLCIECDIALNALVLRWMFDRKADEKMEAYAARLRKMEAKG